MIKFVFTSPSLSFMDSNGAVQPIKELEIWENLIQETKIQSRIGDYCARSAQLNLCTNEDENTAPQSY